MIKVKIGKHQLLDPLALLKPLRNIKKSRYNKNNLI